MLLYILIILLIVLCFVLIKTQESMQNMGYNVVFAGTCKNIESYVKKSLENIEECGKLFKSFKVIIYENDSIDNTRNLLNEYKKDNYYYIFEDNIQEPRRTMRIANGRNKILEKMNDLGNFDYLIMLDLDDVTHKGTFIETIKTCFKHDKWDVLTANQKNKYYDLWALRMHPYIDYDIISELSRDDPIEENGIIYNKLDNTKFEKGLIEVESAFGGIAVYKISSIKNCKYIGEHIGNKRYPDHSEQCEHVEFNQCIKNNGGKIFINTEFYTD
jgi:hypothetical protein